MSSKIKIDTIAQNDGNCPKMYKLSKNCQHCEKCQKLSKLSKIVNIFKNCHSCPNLSEFSIIVQDCKNCRTVGHVMFSHHSDQLSQRSQGSIVKYCDCETRSPIDN